MWPRDELEVMHECLDMMNQWWKGLSWATKGGLLITIICCGDNNVVRTEVGASDGVEVGVRNVGNPRSGDGGWASLEKLS